MEKFGNYVKMHREKLKISQRKFAAMVGVSHVYMSSIENGRRPAPSDKVLAKMVTNLQLSGEDKVTFYDLAYMNKKSSSVSPDIIKYINEHPIIRVVLTISYENDVPMEEWEEFSRLIREKYF